MTGQRHASRTVDYPLSTHTVSHAFCGSGAQQPAVVKGLRAGWRTLHRSTLLAQPGAQLGACGAGPYQGSAVSHLADQVRCGLSSHLLEALGATSSWARQAFVTGTGMLQSSACQLALQQSQPSGSACGLAGSAGPRRSLHRHAQSLRSMQALYLLSPRCSHGS